MFEMQEDISATEFRELLSSGKSINKFLPEHVSEKEIREIFDKVS